MNTRRLAAFLLLAAALAVAGCGIQPWVKPYERDRLADPIMSLDRNPVSAAYTNHVREVPRRLPEALPAAPAAAADATDDAPWSRT